MALLYETVPAFENTWTECLGDLGRYRMAIEDHDIRDREVWTSVSRYWYSKASNKAPYEFDLDIHATVMVDANMTNTNKTYRVTGWALLRNVDGTNELKGNETYAETKQGPHKVFLYGKSLLDVEDGVDVGFDIDEEVVIEALRREVIN
ncbi:hypothetical protein F4779DRAFT_622305 [Xylariaceae sp. FL0662B]|nr:hypothetical protein F4779DRAFT_622305 [Xylariaceae sp. FL0662B]